MKTARKVFLLTLLALVCLAFIACGTTPADTTPATTTPPNTTPAATTPAETTAHTHSWGDWAVTKAATCTEAGEETRTCACGEKEIKTIKETEHSKGEWIIDLEPTCGEAGSQHRACTTCGNTLETRAIAKTNKHTRVNVDAIDPTCSENGSTAGISCSVCGQTVSGQSNIPATNNHNFHSGTCTNCGLTAIESWDISKQCDGSLYANLYKIGSDYALSISGVGEAFGGEKPYEKYKSQIVEAFFGGGITKIPYSIFNGFMNLKRVTIPDTVIEIDSCAFYFCWNLTSITIPESVTRIGSQAFYDCYNLASVTFEQPEGEMGAGLIIGDRAFSGCTSLASITIPDRTISIGFDAFTDCAKSLFTTQDGLIYVNDWVVKPEMTNIRTITFRENTKGIAVYAFSECKNITSIVIPESVTSISACAFIRCSSLTSVTIPTSVTSIAASAFSGCSGLTSVTIPDSVASIGYCSFYKCSSLTSIIIPDSVTSIGESAFQDCSKLTDVYYSGTEEQWKAITIGDVNWNLTDATIHYNSK